MKHGPFEDVFVLGQANMGRNYRMTSDGQQLLKNIYGISISNRCERSVLG